MSTQEKIVADEAARQEEARLDGCYVIKTDLPETAASRQVVHDRYKDLTDVEMAFRTRRRRTWKCGAFTCEPKSMRADTCWC